MPQSISLPERMHRSGVIERAGTGADDREVHITFSSEAPVARWFGEEILGHRQGEVRTGWIGSGRAPLLVDHRQEIDAQIGTIRSVEMGRGRGEAVVRFGSSPRAQEILARVRDGELSAISVGYRIHEMEVASERNGVTSYRVTDWEPLEVSVVAVPADTEARIERSRSAPPTVNIIVKGGDPMDPETDTRTAAQAPNPAPTAPAQPAAASAPSPADIEARVQERMQGELKRREEIEAIRARFNMPKELADKAVRSQLSVEAFRGVALDHVGARQAAETTRRQSEIGMSEGERKQFSMVRLLAFLADPSNSAKRNAASFELEASAAAEKHYKRSARGAMVPADVLGGALGTGRRDLTAGAPAAGGNLVATELMAGSFIEMLRNRAVVVRSGARLLTGLEGNIAIPAQTGGAAAGWVAEGGNVGESQATFAQVRMSPKTIGAFTDISRQLLLQSSLDVESLVRSDLATAVALEIDRAALYGSGTGSQPTGVSGLADVNSFDFAAAEPTFGEIVDMETAVAAENADLGTLAYVMRTDMRGYAKQTEKFAGSGQTIWEAGNTVNGYTAQVSNQVTSGDLFFGNWADLMIGFWSGLDLLVDPYTGGTAGTVRVIVHQDADIAARHAESFCICSGGA